MSKDSLFFSIIIPTYNRPKQLKNCLAALTNLNFPISEFEVIIVDDGSKFSLESVITQYSKQLPILYLRKENEGPAAARNFGSTIAKGRYLAFTDDDCLPESDWLKVIKTYLLNNPKGLVGGQTINKLVNNPFSATSQLIIDIVYQHYNSNENEAMFFTSNNMIIPKNIFEEIGGFSPKWRTSEDRELCDRWLMHKARMIYLPTAIVYHAHDLTLWGFCKQHFSYGQGAYHFHKIRKRRDSGSIHKDISFHLQIKNWLFQPFKNEKFSKAIVYFSLLIVWQISNLLGFLWEIVSPKHR